MTTKKKIIVSMTSMGLAVAAALGVTFGVLAAQNQAINNSFSVSYQATNVSATASASYLVKNGERVNFTGGTAGVVTFSPADASTTSNPETLSAASAELTAVNNYVIYTYEFHNTNSANGRAMTVTLDDDSTATNVNVYYYSTSSAAQITSANYYTVLGTTTNAQEQTVPALTKTSSDPLVLSTSVPGALEIAAGQYGYFYIVVEIVDDTLDASYTSATTADSGITWALAAVVSNS